MRVSSSLLAGFMGIASGQTDEATYEVWACDQSNSVADLDSLGTQGSFLWIWDSNDVGQVSDSGATPASKPCIPEHLSGPCNLMDMFPSNLVDSNSGNSLADSTGFGRWHGITRDPQNKYVTANIFAPLGGYLGIVDAETKEAVALFRVSLMTYAHADATRTTRNNHMSFWNSDGSAILVHNLAGKAVERINVARDNTGRITSLEFDRSATVGFGRGMSVAEEASFFEGNNAFGRPLIGSVTGNYSDADLGDLTPSGNCKENGCTTGEDAVTTPGRPNNVPICPVMASNDLVFNTFGGGGLLVTDSRETPMTIVGEHGNAAIYGAGVCGESVADTVYFTSGNSASGAGLTHSMWALWGFDATAFDGSTNPGPSFAHEFEGTATGGRTVGAAEDTTGQIPGQTTRRDAHDLAGTIDGNYIHVVDRIQDVIDVFDTRNDTHVGSYSIRSVDGAVANHETAEGGACEAASVTDGGADFPLGNPAADFIAATPDGRYMMLALRGPAPVSAAHSAQGSCPGVGVVELQNGGASGRLVAVLRSTNTVSDSMSEVSPAGGVAYPGTERSDVHDVVVITKTVTSAPSPASGGSQDASAEGSGDQGSETAAGQGNEVDNSPDSSGQSYSFSGIFLGGYAMYMTSIVINAL